MVDKKESAHIITHSKYKYGQDQSLKRWFKHAFYFTQPSRFFAKSDYDLIADAVKQAEEGHIGEIQVVIEAHLPIKMAFYQNPTHRARQLFAELGVWDTEHNSGILLYINLCESRVEIVFDRGVQQHTEAERWSTICQNIIIKMQKQQYTSAIQQGVQEIGSVLKQYYSDLRIQDENINELSNQPTIL
ncbi:TPM domain-containing protein [Acinetobacter apis]|uniref:TLP18.3, Psb32 and MOLO-1 founding protein of phosphatase n=1 Tax=Acinetobacter apis TaxID=1229165 RepID=A0A217EHI6_9GAMM|nr:TPM domain-containing protein [Acinetobacter apis]SNQ29772.1 TLP18.3, Psb32 and MOLO-1 founding protein of phosphatase [Acinetobacter apis]